MKTVWRYEIPIDDSPHEIQLQVKRGITTGLYPIAAASVPHRRSVELWFEVLVDYKPLVVRQYRVYGTGQDIPDKAKWVDTCHRDEQGLVWHVYDVTDV